MPKWPKLLKIHSNTLLKVLYFFRLLDDSHIFVVLCGLWLLLFMFFSQSTFSSTTSNLIKRRALHSRRLKQIEIINSIENRPIPFHEIGERQLLYFRRNICDLQTDFSVSQYGRRFLTIAMYCLVFTNVTLFQTKADILAN